MSAAFVFCIAFFLGVSTLEVPSFQNLAVVTVVALLLTACVLVVQAVRGER